MRRGSLFIMLCLLALVATAQEPVRFGDRQVYLEANVRSKLRAQQSSSSLELGNPLGAKLNILLQFENGQIPYKSLEAKGIVLGDYLGSNAYYAQVAPGSAPSDFVGLNIRSAVPIRSEWKVVEGIYTNDAPEWATEGDKFKMRLFWFPTVGWEQLKAQLNAHGVQYSRYSDVFRVVELTATRDELLALADIEAVTFLNWTEPPVKLFNQNGAHLTGAAALAQSTQLGGYGLTGKGIRMGIWDGDVLDHIDYGTRVHRCEMESAAAATQYHGMHTTGTIVGNGLLDSRARGIAPEAEIWTWNFNQQSNGLLVQQEMLRTYMEHHISLTSNSYGYSMEAFCGQERYLNYTILGNILTDYIAYLFPEMTHVYAAGNDQGACNQEWGHSTQYGKNIISVGALNADASMSDYSSFGPLTDGRVFPIISARGTAVYSTIAEHTYNEMDGTSMATPMVTGHLALLSQRWMQLHGGALPYNYFLKALIANTADDAGNPGPDYKFGFGILNAQAAITAMEKEWYVLDKVENGATKTHEITVPDGVQELRVMLVWNDPVVQKFYATGESPMINNLDLALTIGGKQHLPLTLDMQNPNAVAVEKVNTLDNIKQIVVKNPATGLCTVEVAGTVRMGAEQPYALVYYFDYKKPSILSPLAGEVYAPEENILLHTQNLVAPLKVELSTDGGTQYKALAGDFNATTYIQLPKDAEPTPKAVLRVTDARGYRIESPMFGIMPQVIDVQLEAADCETENWKLSWAKVEKAEKYEILRAKVADERYEVIGDVKGVEEFQIPPDKLYPTERQVFAVRAVGANGLRGQRSIGILAKVAATVTISKTDLPYFESFVEWPTPKVSFKPGANVLYQIDEELPAYQLPFGSHVLLFAAKLEADEWEDPFTKQRDNVLQISTCKLNLTGIPAGTPLQFVAYYYQAKTANPNGSMMRLLINNEEVPDVLNRKQIAGDQDEHNVAYDITKYAGQEISLTMEFAVETDQNIGALLYYKIVERDTKPDLSVVRYTPIAAKPYMKTEPIRFKIANEAAIEAKNVPVTVQVDGEAVWTEFIPELKPFEERTLSVNYNFDSEEAHIYHLTLAVNADGDQDAENNTLEFEVYNMGHTITMPEMHYEKSPFGMIPLPGKDEITFTGHHKFSDGRGPLKPYNTNEQGLLKLNPKKHNGVAQITFTELDLAKGDSLCIFTQGIPETLRVKGKQAQHFITSDSKAPQTFRSEASDGSITVVLLGYNKEPGNGWLADLDELDFENQWQITDVAEIAGTIQNQVKIQYKIKNLLPAPFYDLGLFVTVDGKRERILIPELKPGENTFILAGEYTITTPMRKKFNFELPRDGEEKDNVKEFVLIREPLWKGGLIRESETCYIEKMAVVGMPDTMTIEPAQQILYMTDKTVTLYTKSVNAIQFMLSKKLPKPAMLPASIRVWVDLNDDNTLDDAHYELFTATLDQENQTYWLDIDYTKAAQIKTGKHRMRVLLSKDEDYDKFKKGQEIDWGHAFDLTVDLKDEKSPVDFEVALLSFEDLKSGKELNDNTPIKVKVRNNGLSKITKLKLALKVNDKDPVEEEIACDIAPHFATAVLEFQAKADLSEAGIRHNVVVTLKDVDHNEKDNELRGRFVKLLDRTNTLYGLAFVGSSEEGIVLPDVGNKVKDATTLEGWWKLDEPQRSTLLAGSGIQLNAIKGLASVPDNTLALVCGKQGIFISKTPVLTPGEWQHIAIAMNYRKSYFGITLNPILYVNGKRVDMLTIQKEPFAFTRLVANYKFIGQNAMIRVWNKKCSQQEINKNMTKSVRGADTKLPDACMGEYIFTEGKGFASSFGEGLSALIVSERTDIWKPIDKLIRSVKVDKQWKPAEVLNANAFKAFVLHDANLKEISLAFDYLWSDAKVMQGTTEVKADTKLDFTTGTDNTLTFTAEKNDLLGCTVKQTFTIQLVKDLDNRCDLKEIVLTKAKNPGLKADIEKKDPEQMIVFAAEDASTNNKLNAQQLKLLVKKISENAKVFVDDKEYPMGSEGAEIEANLTTQPLQIRIVAQNGRDAKIYFVSLAMTQSITWTQDAFICQFGDKKDLTASASSGLAVRYRSLDPSIATVDKQGKLLTVGIGKTKILAGQEGTSLYKPAAEVEKEVEVQRANLTIKVKDLLWPLGSSMPRLEFKFDGPVAQGAEYLLDWPYEIQFTDGKVWDGVLALQKGEYVLSPKNYTQPYESGNYKITREKGKLIVTDPTEAKTITFVVKDESAAPVHDAKILCDDKLYTTNAEGIANIYLLPDDKDPYTAQISKEGYQSIQKQFLVTDNMQFELKLLRNTIQLTYKADANGLISGKASQLVPLGQDGEQVIALPKDKKHRFKKWSDNVMTAARTDKNITANIDVTAEFEEIFYTLTYEVSEGGEFESEETTRVQKIEPGKDGAEVKVKAKDGYVFNGWADGTETPARTDKEIWESKTLYAIFSKPYNLAWTENFDGTTVLNDWLATRHNEGNGWQIVRYKLDGNNFTYTIGIVPKYEKIQKPRYKNSMLAMPWLSIENRDNTAGVKISFLVEFEARVATAKLQYRFEDTQWTDLDEIQEGTTFEDGEQNFSIEASKLTGKKQLRFRCFFDNSESYEAALVFDDIKITFDPEPTNIVPLRYFAGDNGSLQLAGATEKTNHIELTTAPGTMGQKVTAIPDDGYEFVKWSDGKDKPERQDDAAVSVQAIFKKKSAPKVRMTYLADANGKIVGQPVQKVEKGQTTVSVLAVAKQDGYIFDQWDDGLKDNPRSDTPEADKTVTAQFREAAILTYTSTGYGHVEGNTKQTIAKGADGTEVEAVPDAGCEFLGWSDGLMTPKRTDKNVQQNITVEARFAKVFKVELVVKSGEGTIEIEGFTAAQLEKVPMKSELTVVAKPKNGWKLTALKAGKSNILKTMKFTVYKDVTVEAVFEEDTPVREATFAKVSVAPNPFAEQLTIKNEELLGGSYVLLNANGQSVRSGALEVGETHIPTGELTSGLYLLRLTAANGATTTYRLVK